MSCDISGDKTAPSAGPMSSVMFCRGKKLASARRNRIAGNSARKK
jgi:hypothetical protein